MCFVLWDGEYFGGAETVTLALASELQGRGMPVRVVFVGNAGVYRPTIERAGLSFDELSLERGSNVLFHPKRFAACVEREDIDLAVLPSPGFLARSLRMGGFRKPLIAVEHGGLLQFPVRPLSGKIRDVLDRAIGLGVVEAQVAVSEYMREMIARTPHAPIVRTIHNGVDIRAYRDAARLGPRNREVSRPVTIGAAGKLRIEKGFRDILHSLRSVETSADWRLLIAGEGPDEQYLRGLAGDSGLSPRVEFCGWTDDMPSFWARCDLAVAASNGSIESFGMTVAEAFASGIPAIVSRSGGMPEVLGSSGAGAAYEPGDVDALSKLLSRFIDDEPVRLAAGEAASARSEEFSIQRSADAYLQLGRELLARKA